MLDNIIERDSNGIAHIVALSGGKDSTAMSLKLTELYPDISFNYICTPTSNESPEMFLHWQNLSKILNKKIYPITNGTLKSCIDRNNSIPNFRMRFCTRELKLIPYLAFVKKSLPAISYIGLRYDEMDRGGMNSHGGDLSLPHDDELTQRYPLQEIKWTIDDVNSYLKEKNIIIPDRTDCEWCFWQKLGEWYLLWLNRRDSYMEAVALEDKYGHTFRSQERDTWPASLKDLAIEFQKGRVPTLSLKMMEKRKHMCRICSL